MSNEQARIDAYLELALDQRNQDGVVDVVLQANLDASGFDLTALDETLDTLAAERG